MLDALAAVLAGQGLPVWLGRLPAESAPALALLELPGEAGWRAFDGPLAAAGRVEVLARAAGYEAARLALAAALARLAGAPARAAGWRLLAVIPGPAYAVGVDDAGRWVVAAAVDCVAAREA